MNSITICVRCDAPTNSGMTEVTLILKAIQCRVITIKKELNALESLYNDLQSRTQSTRISEDIQNLITELTDLYRLHKSIEDQFIQQT